MSIIQRLNTYMEHTGLSSSQFADAAAIPRPSMSQILNGRNKKVSNELIEKLHVAFPKLNIVWLMFGEGPMETTANTQTSEPQNGSFPPADGHFHPDSKPVGNPATTNPGNTDLLPSTKNSSDNSKSAPKTAGTVPPGLFDSIRETSVGKGSYPAAAPTAGADIAAESEDPVPYGLNHSADNSSQTRGLYPSGDYGISVLCSAPTTGAATHASQAPRGSRGIHENHSDVMDRPAATGNEASGALSDTSRSSERRIASIMVFYTDNSFQIFKPDGSPENSN